jgi:hypothetical protein
MAEYVRYRMTAQASQDRSTAKNPEFEHTVKIETAANDIINAIINGGLAWLMLVAHRAPASGIDLTVGTRYKFCTRGNLY